VELILADGTIVEAEMFDSPRGLGFEIRYWLAVVERSADVVEVRALAADGSMLKTTGEWPAGQPHIVRFDQVDYNVNFDTFAGPGDPIFQRLPTADSTGMRFSVEGAPVELAFTIEHEGGSTIEVRYRCDAGPGGVPPEVRYDEPRGAGGSGRFVLNVAEGATLCDWFVTKWDGNFRIRSAD
jgi:hypothetical protein